MLIKTMKVKFLDCGAILKILDDKLGQYGLMYWKNRWRDNLEKVQQKRGVYMQDNE